MLRPPTHASVRLDGVPEGYRAMNQREALKVTVTPVTIEQGARR
jgi:hypothetical protein